MSVRYTRFFLLVLSAIVVLGGVQRDSSADDAAKLPASAVSDKTPPPAEFQTAFQDWKRSIAALHMLQLSFQDASPGDQEVLTTKFEGEMNTGRKHLERLQTLAETAFTDGSRHPDVVNILMLSAEKSFEHDRFEDSKRFSTILLPLGDEITGLHSVLAASAFATDDFETAAAEAVLAAKSKTVHPAVEKFFESAAHFGGYAQEIAHVAELWKTEAAIRAEEARKDDLPRVKLETSQGPLVLELYEDQAPNTVASFISLVKKGFYDGIVFHRVLPHFMAQGGDPTGTGSGGPGYTIPDETNRDDHRKHFYATLSMAKTADPDTGGSQFFLTFRPTSSLDGRHTVFGRVIEGFEVLSKIRRIDPDHPTETTPDKIVKATVLRDRGHAYEFKKSSEK